LRPAKMCAKTCPAFLKIIIMEYDKIRLDESPFQNPFQKKGETRQQFIRRCNILMKKFKQEMEQGIEDDEDISEDKRS
jgi:hypothetical protein